MWCWLKRFSPIFFMLLFMGCKSGNMIQSGNKIYPEKWQIPIEAALSHYPELQHVRIEFRERIRIVPLATRPSWFSLLKPHLKRTYLITISRKSIPMLTPILLENLSPKAQIGVIGHELAHVADMKRFRFWGFLKHGFRYTFSGSYGDTFEFQTDSLCIEHGLGFELLAWSVEVRQKLGSTQFFQEKSKSQKQERYMNPETILKQMKKKDFVLADSLKQ